MKKGTIQYKVSWIDLDNNYSVKNNYVSIRVMDTKTEARRLLKILKQFNRQDHLRYLNIDFAEIDLSDLTQSDNFAIAF